MHHKIKNLQNNKKNNKKKNQNKILILMQYYQNKLNLYKNRHLNKYIKEDNKK